MDGERGNKMQGNLVGGVDYRVSDDSNIALRRILGKTKMLT